MNAPNLSKRLASRIVEGLKGRGRILVVKGGTAALVRVLDDAMATIVEPLAKTLAQNPAAVSDPATTAALANLTSRVSRALLASEHLEDVFADRSVVEREVFDTARSTLQEATEERDEATIRVELDLLGYVATTLGKRAETDTLVRALAHAGQTAGAELVTYDPTTRQATFRPNPPIHPDLRLELEEAVDDELCALVQEGAVTLPTLERTEPLHRETSAAERARLSRLIDRLATHTLRRTGNAARWELSADGREVRVVFTPLSEQDARDLDDHVKTFAREIDALFADAGAPERKPELEGKAVAAPKEEPTAPKEEPAAPAEVEEAEPEAEEEAEEETPAKKPTRTRVATKRAPRSTPRTPAPRATTKKRATTTKRASTPAEEPARKKSSATTTKRARTTTTKRTTKKR